EWEGGGTGRIRSDEDPPAYREPADSIGADSVGGFSNMSFSPTLGDAGRTFTVTAVGQSSRFVAQTTFTDSTPIIQSVSVSPFSPNQTSSTGVKDTTLIGARNSGGGTVSDFRVRIHAGTVAGLLVREFLLGSVAGNSNPPDTTWDGKDTGGSFVADGTYIAV